jgi:hypothetical protein
VSNVFTGAVVSVLVMLSIILTASVLYPEMGETTILAILGAGPCSPLPWRRRLPSSGGKIEGFGPTASGG